MVRRFLKHFLIFIIVFIAIILVAWKLDRTFWHPYLPNRNDEIRDAVTTTKFTIPKTKEECEAKNGVWRKMGIRPTESCNFKTTDSGKICQDSHQCEGVCLANLSKDQMNSGMRGKLFKTEGKCSEWVVVMWCRAYVSSCWASVVCAD